MKIVITCVGPWYDKGEAAMIIATAKDLREKHPFADITILRGDNPMAEDIEKYRQYDLLVLPRPFPYSFSYLKPLKYKIIKAMVALPIGLFPIASYFIWLFLYKKLNFDIKFLIKNKESTIKELVNADCFIICGGQNITGFDSGTLIPLLEIIYCKLLDKPVMIWANSLGPFNVSIINPYITWVLNKVDIITTRESYSKKILEKMGVTSPLFVTADAAYTLPSIAPDESKKLLKKFVPNESNDILVGITVIAKNTDKQYVDTLAKAADYIIETFKARIVFFPQVIIPLIKDDRSIAIKILEKIKNKSKVTVIMDDFTPEQIKGLYGCMQFVIGTRFHSCILAQSMNVPTIAIEYEGHKAKGIMDMLELGEYVCDIDKIDPQQLISKIDLLWERQILIKKKLYKNIKMMQQDSRKNVELAESHLFSK